MDSFYMYCADLFIRDINGDRPLVLSTAFSKISAAAGHILPGPMETNRFTWRRDYSGDVYHHELITDKGWMLPQNDAVKYDNYGIRALV